MPVNNGIEYSLHEDVDNKYIIFVNDVLINNNIDLFLSEIYDSEIHLPYILDWKASQAFQSNALNPIILSENFLNSYGINL